MRRFPGVGVAYVPDAVDPPELLDKGGDAPSVSVKNLLFLGCLAMDHKGLDRLLHGIRTLPGAGRRSRDAPDASWSRLPGRQECDREALPESQHIGAYIPFESLFMVKRNGGS